MKSREKDLILNKNVEGKLIASKRFNIRSISYNAQKINNNNSALSIIRDPRKLGSVLNFDYTPLNISLDESIFRKYISPPKVSYRSNNSQQTVKYKSKFTKDITLDSITERVLRITRIDNSPVKPKIKKSSSGNFNGVTIPKVSLNFMTENESNIKAASLTPRDILNNQIFESLNLIKSSLKSKNSKNKNEATSLFAVENGNTGKSNNSELDLNSRGNKDTINILDYKNNIDNVYLNNEKTKSSAELVPLLSLESLTRVRKSINHTQNLYNLNNKIDESNEMFDNQDNQDNKYIKDDDPRFFNQKSNFNKYQENNKFSKNNSKAELFNIQDNSNSNTNLDTKNKAEDTERTIKKSFRKYFITELNQEDNNLKYYFKIKNNSHKNLFLNDKEFNINVMDYLAFNNFEKKCNDNNTNNTNNSQNNNITLNNTKSMNNTNTLNSTKKSNTYANLRKYSREKKRSKIEKSVQTSRDLTLEQIHSYQSNNTCNASNTGNILRTEESISKNPLKLPNIFEKGNTFNTNTSKSNNSHTISNNNQTSEERLNHKIPICCNNQFSISNIKNLNDNTHFTQFIQVKQFKQFRHIKDLKGQTNIINQKKFKIKLKMK